MLTHVISDLIIAAHTESSFAADEWAEYVKQLKACQRTHGRVRVLTLNMSEGGPNPAQRVQVMKELDTANFYTAVMSDSEKVHRIVTAMMWNRNKNVAVFHGDDFEGAADHLQIAPVRRSTVKAKLEEFRHKLMRQARRA